MSAPRCKVGDLAVVVGPCETPGLLGRFVVVERLAVHGELLEGSSVHLYGELSWVCSSAVVGAALPRMWSNGIVDSAMHRAIADDILRPIRPNEGEDESLAWSRPVDERFGVAG